MISQQYGDYCLRLVVCEGLCNEGSRHNSSRAITKFLKTQVFFANTMDEHVNDLASGMLCRLKEKCKKFVMYELRLTRPQMLRRTGRGLHHPPSSSAEFKERAELYLQSPCGHSWSVIGQILPLLLQALRTFHNFFI